MHDDDQEWGAYAAACIRNIRLAAAENPDNKDGDVGWRELPDGTKERVIYCAKERRWLNLSQIWELEVEIQKKSCRHDVGG